MNGYTGVQGDEVLTAPPLAPCSPTLPVLGPGQHACTLYQTQAEYDDVLVPFLRQGLERREKVVYVLEDNDPSPTLAHLGGLGLQLQPYLRTGQVTLLPLDDTYLYQGRFDPDRMLDVLRAQTELAIAEGYAGMRFKGETGWALRDVPGAGRLIEYEARLSTFFPGSKCVAICPYHRRRFPPSMLLDVLTTHPQAILGDVVYDNFYFMPAADFLGPDRADATLRNWTDNLISRHRDEEQITGLNRSLSERTAQLEATNKELEAFAYSVSHDLRAPLRRIDGFSLALLEDCAARLDAQGKDYLQRIRSGAQHMAQLIDDILHLSRTTRLELDRRPVDLSALARAAATALREQDPGRQADVRVAGGLTADADPRLMEVVLQNLLGNAWKFTSRRPDARIEVGSARLPDGGRAFFVRDNGAGFDMAYADKLFGVFQRLHTPEEFPGNGVGLATVKRIVHKHGGRVWAEGAVGQGATFYFTLGPGKGNQP